MKGQRAKVRNVRCALVAGAAFAVAVCSSGSGTLRAAEQGQQPSSLAASSPAQRALLDGYCVGCHNQRTKTAGIMFDTMDLATSF